MSKRMIIATLAAALVAVLASSALAATEYQLYGTFASSGRSRGGSTTLAPVGQWFGDRNENQILCSPQPTYNDRMIRFGIDMAPLAISFTVKLFAWDYSYSQSLSRTPIQTWTQADMKDVNGNAKPAGGWDWYYFDIDSASRIPVGQNGLPATTQLPLWKQCLESNNGGDYSDPTLGYSIQGYVWAMFCTATSPQVAQQTNSANWGNTAYEISGTSYINRAWKWRTSVITVPSPEPGSLLAIAAGLIGLGGCVARRRK